MKNDYKVLKIFIIVFNIIGVICLIYFSIPYLRHDMSIPNPNSMLASYSWDSSGFLLTLGFIPLLIVNILAYKFLDLKKVIKFLFFIPSIFCLVIVCHYLFVANEWKSEKNEPIETIRCELDGKVYVYKIYYENDEYSLGIDEKDKLDLSVIDYFSKDSILKSIEEYYKKNGGICP